MDEHNVSLAKHLYNFLTFIFFATLFAPQLIAFITVVFSDGLVANIFSTDYLIIQIPLALIYLLLSTGFFIYSHKYKERKISIFWIFLGTPTLLLSMLLSTIFLGMMGLSLVISLSRAFYYCFIFFLFLCILHLIYLKLRQYNMLNQIVFRKQDFLLSFFYMLPFIIIVVLIYVLGLLFFADGTIFFNRYLSNHQEVPIDDMSPPIQFIE